MIYDRAISILALDDARVAIQRKLTPVSEHFCAPMTVYHKTYFDSAKEGQTVDRMVQIPLHHDIDATMFAQYEAHIFRISEAQATWDRDGLPVTVLSLHRENDSYEIVRP